MIETNKLINNPMLIIKNMIRYDIPKFAPSSVYSILSKSNVPKLE